MKKLILFAAIIIMGGAHAQVNVTGGSSASYTSLGAAFAAINAGTHSGAITVDISASITETAACILNSSGAGSANYTSVLIFPSVDGVTINGSATAATGRGVIELNGADNVTIDGDNPNSTGINRNLTIVNNNVNTTAYASVIRVETSATAPYADANNITIKNLNLNGNATSRNSSGATSTSGSENTTFGVVVGPNGGAAPAAITAVAGGMATGAVVNNFIVDNCAINSVARGIVFNGNTTTPSSTGVMYTNNTIGSAGVLSGVPPYTTPANSVYTKGIYTQGVTGATITSNTLQNILSYVGTTINGIELASPIGSGNVIVSSNSVTGIVNNGSSGANGITLTSAAGTITVAANVITGVQGMAGSVMGLNLGTSALSGLVTNNSISTIYARGTSGYAARGILISNGTGIVVKNNFIWDLNAVANNSSSGTTFGVRGISITGGSNHKIYHNTISLSGAMFTGGSSPDVTACLSISSALTGLDVRNNIFSNTMSGGNTGTNHTIIMLPSGASSAMNLTINNNAYYGTSSVNIGLTTAPTLYSIANFNPSAITPSTNWRSYTSTLGNSSNDNASFASTSAAPFISSSNLHINNSGSTPLESGGAVVGVTTDIDNDSRPGPAGSTNGGGTAPDIGADEFDGIPVPVCSGTPGASNVVASTTLVCLGGNSALNLSATYTALGYAYQWSSSSSSSGPYTAISGATTSVFSATNITAVTWYQAEITCTASGLTSTATAVQISLLGPPTYTTIPFLETFDNTWENRCDLRNVPVAANWSDNPTTGNNSWRRTGDGASANWSSSSGIVPPLGAGSADFHTYDTPSGTTGDLDVYLDMSATGNYNLSFYNYNTGGSDSLLVYLSTNAGANFTKVGGYKTASTWTKQNISLGAVSSASSIVRFRGKSDFGASDIGLDSVQVKIVICVTPPFAGTINGPTTATVGNVNSYTVTPTTGNIQWYQSTSPGGSLTAIANATTSTVNITATPSGTLYYTVIASSLGCPNDTANVALSVTVTPLPGDMACSALPLPIGPSTTYYKLFNYTNQAGEVAPIGGSCSSNTTWCNATLNNTRWFTFTAPASGNVSVQSPGFDTQLAVWSTSSCAALTTPTNAVLIGANDDDGSYTTHAGAQFSSYVRALCLTPGATYYIQLDSYGTITANDSTKVLITDLGANSFSGLSSSYCIPSNVSSALTPNIPGGVFTLNTNTPSITAFTPSVAGVGTHTVNYTAFGCTSNSVVMVNANPVITTANSSSAICVGNTMTVTASGASTYSWNTNATTSTISVNPNSNTVYSVTGTSTAGCTGTAAVTVSVNSLPLISITGTNAVCDGVSANLTGNGATTYSWNTGSSSVSIVVTPSVSTSYTVTGTDANNCSDTASFMLTVNPNPTVSVSGGAICPGASYTLAPAGANTYTYLPNGPVVSPSSTTTYSISGTDALGCVSQNAATAVVTVTNNLNVTITGNTTICYGQPANLTAGGASTYSWNIGASTNSVVLTPTANTTYSVVGSSGSCSNTAVVTVTVNALPSVSLTASSSTACTNGSTIALTGSPVGGSYSGTNVSGNMFMPPAVSGTYTSTYSYTDTVTGCSDSTSTSIAVSVCTGLSMNPGNAVGLQVYPNPNLGEFTIELSNGTHKQVEVSDLTGRIILSELTSNDKVKVNISNLANGVYFVKVQSNNSVEVVRIIKQ